MAADFTTCRNSTPCWVRSHRTWTPWRPPLHRQAGNRLQISPARAANLFGLSSQVPAKTLYLTDGSSRPIKIGNQVVYLSTRVVRVLWLVRAPKPT